jgi:hypothetical protein
VANLLVRHKGKNAPDQIQALGLDCDYLNRLGLLDRVTAWSAAWQDP